MYIHIFGLLLIVIRLLIIYRSGIDHTGVQRIQQEGDEQGHSLMLFLTLWCDLGLDGISKTVLLRSVANAART